MVWSVESLPSNSTTQVRFFKRSEILISILELGVCPLSVFCLVLSLVVALTYRPQIQGDLPLCICLILWSIICASPTGN